MLQIYAIQKLWRTQVVARLGGSRGVALATDATSGFAYLPSCAGPPTGTPDPQGDLVPMVIDSVNDDIYIYTNGAWHLK